jgi:cytochrome o ubiquinol oxidase operon protein cyoD
MSHDINNIDKSHGTYKSYILGFTLSILLTLGSYFIVTMDNFSPVTAHIGLALLAFLQLIVQLVFFLHLTVESKPRWNLTSFFFTVIITFILVGGSLWVMYNLNYNMM